MTPLRAIFVWILAALGLATMSASAIAQGPQRIVAVGDLHGDHAAWMAIARSAGLVDSRGRWSGGRTTLVQLGDIADRGPDSRKIIDHLQKLQKAAKKAGGKVVVLVGNHEAMNVIGDLRYVHPGEYEAFVDRSSERRREQYYQASKDRILADYRALHPDWTDEQIRADWMGRTPLGMIEHRLAWSPTGPVGRWVVANPAAVRIGGTIFVHGGISPPYAALGLDEINRRVAAALEQASRGPQSILEDPLGPLWYRGLAGRRPEPAPADEAAENVDAGQGAADKAAPTGGEPAAVQPASPPLTLAQEVDLTLTALGASRFVIGHTPVLTGIDIAEGGKVINIDSGIAAHYGGTLSWLEIVGDKAIPHKVPRPAESARQ